MRREHFGDLHFSEHNSAPPITAPIQLGAIKYSASTFRRPSLQRTQSVVTDFEHAALLAYRRIFPDAQQHRCFFHMSQCRPIWRRIQQTPALQERYTSDSDFAVSVRTLAALAFIPLPDIVQSFEELIDSPFFQQNEEVLRDLVNYFEDTWIGRPNRRGGRAEPLFPHALWNCVDAVHADLPKTNNAVEGWHRGFSELLGSNHPSILKFISALQKEQSMNEMTMEQYIAGATPALGRRVYRDTAEPIDLYWTICVASRTTLISKFDLDYFVRRGFGLSF